MNQSEFPLRGFDFYIDIMRRVEKTKGEAYGSTDDPLKNYTEAGELFGDPPERVMMARVAEKIRRIANSIKRGEVISLDDAVDIAIISLKAHSASERTLGKRSPDYEIEGEDIDRTTHSHHDAFRAAGIICGLDVRPGVKCVQWKGHKDDCSGTNPPCTGWVMERTGERCTLRYGHDGLCKPDLPAGGDVDGPHLEFGPPKPEQLEYWAEDADQLTNLKHAFKSGEEVAPSAKCTFQVLQDEVCRAVREDPIHRSENGTLLVARRISRTT